MASTNDGNRQMLGVLLQNHLDAYRNAAADRGRLAKVEWDGSRDAPSILGRMEMLGADVAGIAQSCLRDRWRADMTMEEAIEFLESRSIFDTDYLVDWIGEHGSEYARFLRNMLATEGLRVATVKYLRHAPGSADRADGTAVDPDPNCR